MTFKDLIAHEWKTRFASSAVLIGLGLFISVLIYGAVNGRMSYQTRLDAIHIHVQKVEEKRDIIRASLQEQEKSGHTHKEWLTYASYLPFTSYLPPGPLGDFAIGQSDMRSSYGVLGLQTADIHLFSHASLSAPITQALGGFDLSKAVVLIVPLALIFLCFDVLSADRDSNRLKFMLAQGVNLQRLIWGRLLIRAAIVFMPVACVAVGLLLLPVEGISWQNRLPDFLWWLGGAAIYTVFWTTFISVLVVRKGSSERHILLLLCAWFGLVLIVPAAAKVIIEGNYQTPSRPSYLAQARLQENAARLTEKETANRYLSAHPEIASSPAKDAPAYIRTNFLAVTAADQATLPLFKQVDLMVEKRERLLNKIGYISPVIFIYRFFNELTGTSIRRHHAYHQQALAFKTAFRELAGPSLFLGERLSLRNIPELPAFHFRELPENQYIQPYLLPFIALAITSILLMTMTYNYIRQEKWQYS